MRIDLHGYHVHEGWHKFKILVDDAYFKNIKRCTVITGQGIMAREFPTWANNHRYIREWKPTTNNPGSFLIILTKRG
jgi:DNA-nicking Smr family endonuclease